MLPTLSLRNRQRGEQQVNQNLAICLTITGNKGFSVLMTDMIPDLHLIGDVQCFPLYLYETEENK
nr:type ISP restriction/modification enzyme [Acinetobacter venetianus]